MRARLERALSPKYLFGLMARSFLTLVAGEAGARAIGVVVTIILARELHPGGFGLISTGIVLVGWFRLVVDSGTESLNVREIARRPDRFREIADPVLGLRLALSVVAAGAFVIGGYVLTTSPSSRAVLLRFALVLPAIALNLRWMVLGIRQAKAIAIGNVASRVAVLVGVVLFVTSAHDIRRVPLLEAIGEAAYAGVIIYIVARGFGLVRPRLDLAVWKSTLRQSAPLFVYGLCRATILTLDVFLIQLFIGPRNVGWYTAGYRPAVFFLGALGIFSVTFLAHFSSASEGEARSLFRRTTRVNVLAALALAAVVAATASVTIPLLFGNRYEPAVAVLAIFVWTVPLAALDVSYSSVLIARDRQGLLMWNNIVGALFNVAALCLLVPLVGINGAAAVRVVTYALVLALDHRTCVARGLAPPISALVGRGGSKAELERSRA